MNCQCDLCKGKYIQVDPVDCGCTECITGEYRPAINEEDYKWHQENHCVCEIVSGDNKLCKIHNNPNPLTPRP